MSSDTKELIIVCEDSFGMDVYSIVGAINEYPIEGYNQSNYRVLGYLLPKDRMGSPVRFNLPVLGAIEEWKPSENEYYAMGIVQPRRKEWAVNLLKEKKAVFVQLRAPWALVPFDVDLGEGSIIAAISVKEGVKIGPFTLLYQSMVAAAEIEAFCSVMAFANITNAHLEKCVFVDENASVMMNLTIGEDACVLPNSVVVKNVKPRTTVSGIPARRVKGNKEE